MLNSGNVLPVKIQPPLLRPLAYRILSKKYGLNIKSDGLASLAEFIGNMFGMNWKKNTATLHFLEHFALIWRQQERGLFVDSQGVKDVISEMKEREKASISTSQNKEIGSILSKGPNNKTITIDKLLVAKSQSPSSPTSALLNENQNDSYPVASQDSSPELTNLDEGDNSEVSLENEQLDWRNYFKVINASDQQKFSYDPHKLQFIFAPVTNGFAKDNSESNLQLKIPNINSYLCIFPTRFYLVRDRVMRNENFQNNDYFNPLSSIAAMQQDLQNGSKTPSLSTISMSITQIKNLLGRDGQNFLLLGLLSKNSKGNWSLEDPSGSIEIDISQALPTKGLYYVPGCIVLVEGIYFTAGNRFHVSSMTHPPGEKRESTLDAIGNLDLLGIHGLSNSNYVPRLDIDLKIRLHYLEKELVDHRFVILGGDVFLDEMATLDALGKVFAKLNEDPPTVIVLQGSFTAVPVHASMSSRNISSTTQYKNNFDTLANLISRFENIANYSTFIFVPGVNDPWGSMVSMGAAYALPQRPVPSYFTQKIQRVCKNVIWGSNPTRIAYLSQEIAILRDDMTDRFKRHSVVFPMIEEIKKDKLVNIPKLQNDCEDLSTSISQLMKNNDQLPSRIQESRKIVKTLLDQGHLSPFATSIRPLIWDLDHSLSLYPIPSTLIVCDTSTPQFDLTYNGCKAFNPGKFVVGRYARYLEYKPSLKNASQQEIYF